jgi:uncharacterized damage-inducible protein DinB
MSESEHLADALIGLFTRTDNGWFTPLTVAVAGLTAEKAARTPAPRFNSVWGLVDHVRYWEEFALLRLRGLPADRAVLGEDWAPIIDPADEAAWQAACHRAVAMNEVLAAYVAGLTDEELAEPYAPGRAKRQQVIQGVIAHNSYHTCEIISVRHMQGLWLEET